MKTCAFLICMAVSLCGQEAKRPSTAPFSISEERARRNAEKRVREGQEPALIKDVPVRLPENLKVPVSGGRVKVSIYIKGDGSVGNVEIISSTNSVFNGPVIEAVKQRLYTPVKKSGKSVEFQVSAEIIFPPRGDASKANATKG